ncbi:uncharacterized protein F5Z01DRAFT_385102 [Emericellopsis atlantica]|uniref:Uncharacterized protein n=1 Tax=Emericellopsis atlantica TaxID=2614577 RepID=A0A9P8CSN9_9HYPO|nr:uncharacterized protein F5Z01DRAFT_385102 [Emericellopsis atlantica]KAG9257400.1 hypothetical protein F5Z01DRAFT_385102 [Emericellopsis atlantica]
MYGHPTALHGQRWWDPRNTPIAVPPPRGSSQPHSQRKKPAAAWHRMHQTPPTWHPADWTPDLAGAALPRAWCKTFRCMSLAQEAMRQADGIACLCPSSQLFCTCCSYTQGHCHPAQGNKSDWDRIPLLRKGILTKNDICEYLDFYFETLWRVRPVIHPFFADQADITSLQQTSLFS